jgi:hypothetical protein
MVGPATQIVAVEGDVDRTARDLDLLELPDLATEARREMIAARADADDTETIGSLVALDDLVGDAGERPLNPRPIQDDAATSAARSRAHLDPSGPLWIRLKGCSVSTYFSRVVVSTSRHRREWIGLPPQPAEPGRFDCA